MAPAAIFLPWQNSGHSPRIIIRPMPDKWDCDSSFFSGNPEKQITVDRIYIATSARRPSAASAAQLATTQSYN
jgi:hypothetical protein